ncbi:MAG: DUF1540 domain-containing protein [Firmicutes bacterium]|nr:DUF1540 domain-containing protein [Bacillota bacterium]
MTLIQCDATNCRHNDQGLCALDQIYVGPGSSGALPDILESSPAYALDDLRPGYASEFEAYVGYATTHPDTLLSGAFCKSYDP